MTTTLSDNKALVRRFVDETVNGQRYELIDDLFTHDYRRHDPVSPETDPGPGPWAASLKGLHEAFPDGEVHVGELVAETDFVSFAGTMTGTHRGVFRGIEPTGTAIEVRGNAMHRSGTDGSPRRGQPGTSSGFSNSSARSTRRRDSENDGGRRSL